ncbi:MAG: hypothetical protein HFF18_04250 [Oscillospiraceae bacterium]|nr:hypothetical protein [Oscillospiraceae bacterium]
MSTIKHISLDNLDTFATQMKEKYACKADVPVKISDLTNDAGYQTGEQVAAAINAKVASTYRAGGSVAFANLPELTEANRGLVVNVTDKFTTTDSFVEGAGQKHPAGTNVAVVKAGEDYKYDVLAGFVDLSGYQAKEDGKGLSTEDYVTEDKTKLAGIAAGATKVEATAGSGTIKVNDTDVELFSVAADTEVTEMLAEVFGAPAE